MNHDLSVRGTWEGAPIAEGEQVSIALRVDDAGVHVSLDAPAHGDAPPDGPPGPRWGLWEHEVVELFVVGPGERYTEVEVGPAGHHLVLRLDGRRRVVERELPLELHVERRGHRWSARFSVPSALLPPRPWRVNAYAIHGVGEARRYLAWAPVPGPAPDFHRLERFPLLLDPAGAAIRDRLVDAVRRAADPARAAHLGAGYAPSTFPHLGAPVPAVRTALASERAALRASPPHRVVAVAEALVREGLFDTRLLAFELIALHRAARAAAPPEALDAWAAGNDAWPLTDAFACGVAGPAWREGTLPTSCIDAWIASPNPWLRRTALVCTVALNVRARGGHGDPERTLAACGRLVDDRHDLVVKALSWALRAAAPWDAAAVDGFLAHHPVAPRVRREVRRVLDAAAGGSSPAPSESCETVVAEDDDG